VIGIERHLHPAKSAMFSPIVTSGLMKAPGAASKRPYSSPKTLASASKRLPSSAVHQSRTAPVSSMRRP
jgi:hypothetical protein